LTPRFYPYVIPFLEDGGTFAVSNLRGGKEYGEEWHRKGMREKKQNVFDDFAAVVEHFKNKGSRVAALGGSNGGLLVGTLLTQHPELVDGALIGYPVLICSGSTNSTLDRLGLRNMATRKIRKMQNF
jgi:prolyl oligopeptidase